MSDPVVEYRAVLIGTGEGADQLHEALLAKGCGMLGPSQSMEAATYDSYSIEAGAEAYALGSDPFDPDESGDSAGDAEAMPGRDYDARYSEAEVAIAGGRVIVELRVTSGRVVGAQRLAWQLLRESGLMRQDDDPMTEG